jgi:hypothetical protein
MQSVQQRIPTVRPDESADRGEICGADRTAEVGRHRHSRVRVLLRHRQQVEVASADVRRVDAVAIDAMMRSGFRIRIRSS